MQGWIVLGFSVAALVIAIIALLRTTDSENPMPVTSSPNSVFRIEKNMEDMGNGGMCVRSAPLPAHMNISSGARRVEGRFLIIRAAKNRFVSFDQVMANVVSCANPIVEGAIWKRPMKLIVDPTNAQGIPRQQVVEAIWKGVHQWESRLDRKIVVEQDKTTCADGFDSNAPDGKNEVSFIWAQEPDVVAVASIWGVFGGPEALREIVEGDVGLNEHFAMGDAGSNNALMDLLGLLSHEWGHIIGSGHTNTPGATMFPSIAHGETHKRDILPCEAKGICEMYGEAGDCEFESGTSIPQFVDIGPTSRCGGGGGGTNPPFNAAPHRLGSHAGITLMCVMGAMMGWFGN